MPLIAYNARTRGDTLKAARYLPAVAVSEKWMMLRHTLDGRALEHYMFRSFPGENIAVAGAPFAELVAHWYDHSSLHPASLLFPALILAMLALPFLRRSPLFRPLLFSWIAAAAAEGAMLWFRDAGGGPHHTVLLDPAPQFIVAATACAIAERIGRLWPVAGAALLLGGANLWLLYGYHAAGQRNGFSVFWTDGMHDLAPAAAAAHLPAAILDWGIQGGIEVETGGQVGIVTPAPLRPGVLYVGHCNGFLVDDARSKPYRDRLSQTRIVTDREGTPLFCLSEARDASPAIR